MLNGHREYLTRNKGRGTSLERTDRDRKTQGRSTRDNALAHGSASAGDIVSPAVVESPVSLQEGNGDENVALPQSRAWKADHRVSMVPEKAWSIGTGELNDGQDGQVEKSITEVLARVEPNTRSRKASHSLRFFKEGLPEEKGKKKESKLGSHTRGRHSPTTESPEEIRPVTPSAPRSRALPTSENRILPLDHEARSRTFPVRLPESRPLYEEPKDYFLCKPGKGLAREPEAKKAKQPPSQEEEVVPEGDAQASEPIKLASKSELDTGHDLDASEDQADTENIDVGDDGEDSGEEKISSAVFLPHQGLEESQELPPVPGVAQRPTPTSRRLSRTGDFHPWLVKADEPEPDHKQASADYERDLHNVHVRLEPAAVHSAVATEVEKTQVDDFAVVDESDTSAHPPKPSRPISQYQEDNVHEHQWAPKQPLDAIELVPYKHQVGGHTTIWRFSRRAVCKQLNNRENEFYERIERYHRDLLPFLPRYVDVCTCTVSPISASTNDDEPVLTNPY